MIGDALTALLGCFPVGALAYITAMSKAENPVRDAIALFIHERIHTAGYAVAREWLNRRDLAVVDRGGAAAVQLEAKALYGRRQKRAFSGASDEMRKTQKRAMATSTYRRHERPTQ